MTKEETLKAATLMVRWARGECEVEEYRVARGAGFEWHRTDCPAWDWAQYEYRERPLSLREKVERLKTCYDEGLWVRKSDVLELIDAT